MNEFKIKPKKEKDRIFITHVISCLFWAFSALFVIYFVSFLSGANIFSFKNFIMCTLCAIPLSVLYAFIVEKFGSGLGDILLGLTSRKASLSEQFSADLAKARLSKGKGQFKEALIIINEVLEKHPKFPEALLLNAQIMWEGFENKELALRNLNKAIELVKDDAPIHRWAVNYYHEVIKGKRTEN